MKVISEDDKFQYCVSIILEHEGGLSRDKRDPGGVTKYGISLRFLRTIGVDIDGDGDIDEEDIIAITKPGSKEIYRKHWWEKYQYNRLDTLAVVSKVFDLAVNMGSVSAHKILQRACNNLANFNLKVDGILGYKSISASNICDPFALRKQLRNFSKIRYEEILEKNPNMEFARKGWMNRASW